jgi:hypothetical protein
MLFVAALATGAVLAGDRAAAQTTAAQGESTPPSAAPATEQAKAPGPAEPSQPLPAGDASAPQDGESTLRQTPGAKALGISILGNQEAPTSLVIVPWKSSELGSSLGVTTVLDDSKQPVDKDVFMRSLRYYEISAGTTRPDGAKGGRDNAAAGSDAAQSVTAAPRRK